jgi:2-oxoglutarate dehydrogenase E2 component (dihydrolipoamide succinyltransferase)
MVAVVKASRKSRGCREVTKQLTLLKIVLQRQLISDSDKFFLPLVKILLNRGGICKRIKWYRKDGRVTKNDILEYVKNRVIKLLPGKTVDISIAEPVAKQQHKKSGAYIKTVVMR